MQFFDEDDDEYEAKVVGRDPLTDSALIQLIEKPNRPLPEAKFGDSSQMEPGDWVMAIGNPFGLAHTVSVGVISATSRPFPVAEQRSANVLQTDAAINPGNSGGPLLNLRGEVIGVNTAIYSNGGAMGGVRATSASASPIPINTIRDVLPGLRSGKITRGRIGVSVRPVSPDEVDALSLKDRRGAIVAQVPPGPAATAGVEPGDVIVEFNGKPVNTQRRSAADRRGHRAGHDRAGEGDSRRQGAHVQRARRRARASTPKRTARRMRRIRAATRARDSASR